MHYSSFFSLESIRHKKLWELASYPWSPLLFIKDYLQNYSFPKWEVNRFPGVIFENPSQIYIAENVTIEPGAYLKGPCIVEEGVIIRHGAYVREFVILEKSSLVGHACEIKHAILLCKASLSHFNYVGDSILGSHVNLGAGVICANFRLDQKEIPVVSSENQRVQTSLRKLGAILGDFSSVGCNSVLNPGSIVEKRAKILPLSHVTGYYKAVNSSFIQDSV